MSDFTGPRKRTETQPDALQSVLKTITNLFKVKTVATLAIVFTLCYKTVQGIEVVNEFVMIATAIVTYYFTKDKKT